MLNLALVAGVSAIALAAGGGGGGGPAGVQIVGTPFAIPTSGAHSTVSSTAYDHPGGGLAAIVSGRPTTGTAQTVTGTWDGTPFEVAENSSGAGLGANDTYVVILLLKNAAAGAKALELNLGVSNSDSVVTLVSLSSVNQADAIGASNSSAEYASSGNQQAAGLTTTAAGSLVLAGAAISVGTTASFAEPFAEVLDTPSDGGTGTSTITQAVAATSPASGATITATATFGASDDGRAVAVCEILAA